MTIKKMLKKDEGFTLVELLIVIAIIAILAAIAIPQFSKYRNNAWTAELQSTAKNTYTAAQAWLSDFGGTGVVCCTGVELASGGLVLYNAAGTTKLGNIGIAAPGTMTLTGGGEILLDSTRIAIQARVCGSGEIVMGTNAVPAPANCGL